MIALSKFLECVQQNVNRVNRYQHGGDGRGGWCDCIGLIIGAVRLAGGEWRGTHGSNWAARNAIKGLSRITGAKDLFLGEIVFKAKEPGESGYELPDKYKDSPDRRDYYHVGVVTSLNPLCITHCTSVEGGIKRDNTLGKWNWGGELKYVNYGGVDMDVLYKATVSASNGAPVRMRQQPSVTSKELASIPVGTVVDVLDELDGWSQISYGGRDGYMMGKFLEPIGSGDEMMDGLRTVKTALETALNIIDKLVG